MKKIKYLSTIWILILSIFLQCNSAFAANKMEMKNTAPEANFTIEKSRNVKIMVLTDYTATDNATLKNALTSMKSELANYSKIDIEYASPSDITIGTQQGKININHWAKNGYATYKWTGYTFNQNKYTEYNNYLTTDKFVYSKYISLPEGQIPDEPYGVPVRYIKSDLKTDTYQAGFRKYYTYTFINNNGLCDGSFNIDEEYYFVYPTMTQELYKIFTEPTFKYDDFWSIQGISVQDVKNTVVGWDLSKLNYEIKDNVDTYVVFALDNSDTDYYSTHISSNYRLGLLRNDSTIGKYVKDTDARVYSICSESLENTNLSVNPQYPITFNQSGQNISLKDLINSSFDGRSIGEKNITGLVNRIKENVRRPSGNIDMVVASDNDIASTNSLVDSIKDSISPDVDVKTNIIDSSSFEDIDIWTKYVVKGDYKLINYPGVDVDLILLGNGELWGRGTNAFINNDYYGYGLLCQDTTTRYHNNFVKITDNVKHAYLCSYPVYTIYIVKNDGTLWVVGAKGRYIDKRTSESKVLIYNTLTRIPEFTDVRSLAFGIFDTWDMFIVSGNGVFRCSTDWFWDLGFPQKDPYAPVNAEYVYVSGSYQSAVLYYACTDNSIYFTTWKYDQQERGLKHQGSFPAPIKDISSCNAEQNFAIVCEDNKIYRHDGALLLAVPVKQYIFNGRYGLIWVLGTDNIVYQKSSYSFSMYTFIKADKILYAQPNNGLGIIIRDLEGKIGFYGEISYANLLSTDDSLANKKAENRSYPKIFDASVANTAVDYFQLGEKFCYVTKRGEICYNEAYMTNEKDYMGQYIWKFRTVNMGRFDALFNTSQKPIKAFPKSKLLNTELREGSERYFIYISDNVKEDTYYGEPSEYFLSGNLDYEILNYLNTNRFNIYVVTPEQARNIKLRYPNVLTEIQQLSLKELIYMSVMDSAFCKDIDTVRKLISKRYDTYTKQGSTTLTLLVNEESVRYNQVYRDFENDPKYSERWLYTHDPTYFDNSNGLDTNSDKWVNEPLYTFSKVGKYTVYAQFRDNPKDDNKFDNYRLWSNKSAPATIYVHRRPIALFSVQVVSKVGTNINLSYLDQSHDLDHNISRTDKGIAQWRWQYKKVDSDAWIEGKPNALPYNSGKFDIQLMVRDIEGVWSKPYIEQIDTNNLPPSIDATPKTYSGYEPVKINITANDHGENDFAYMRYAVTKSTVSPNSNSIDWKRVTDGIKEKNIIIDTEGTYYLHLEAYDLAGQIGKNMTGPYTVILNRPPTVSISYSPAYIYEGDNVEIYMKPVDPDNDTLDLVLEEKKDSGEFITVFTKSACASGSTQTYSITKISAGNYKYRVTVTDPYGETASESLSFMAYPLGINGFVDHTPIWKSNWINYNKHQQNIGKPVFENDTFFTGEKYVLSATTTKISPDSNVTALNVSVKIIERTYSPVLLDKQSSNYFTGEMWNEDMRGTRWRGKQATFLFTVTYSNGTVKTDSVVTNIIDDDYFRVKMSF